MTEKEIKTIYDAIINEEIEKAKELLDSVFVCRSHALTVLKKYSVTLGQEELYKEKINWFLASYNQYFITSIALIKEYEQTGKVNFNSYDLCASLLADLKKFSNKFPKYKEVTKKISDIIKKIYNEYKPSFLESRSTYHTTYEEEFYLIATSENAIDTYRNLDWDEKKFYKKLQQFLKIYNSPKDQELAIYFEEQFKIYLERYKTQQTMLLELEYRKDNLSLAQNIVNDLIVSGMSIIEYCDNHIEYNINDIKKYIKIIYGEYGEGLKKTEMFINALECKSKEKTTNKINYIANEIINNPEFTILDYYLLTKLSLEDFNKLVNVRDISLSKFLAANSTSSRRNSKLYKTILFKPEEELKITRIIKGKLITEEEKKMIFKFMEENQVPINQYTYRACINKLVNEDLDFIQKINVYKGSN